jgi:adenine/guanine phosphoribosyltransferase-like PRPP-binding protein
MAKSSKKSEKKTATGGKAKKSTAKTTTSSKRTETTSRSEHEKRFVDDVVVRGEAAPAGTELPEGATHEVVGVDNEGHAVLKRRRFSIA